MKTFSSFLEVTRKGARGACRFRYSVASVLCLYVYRLRVIVPLEEGLYICAPGKPCGPNMIIYLSFMFRINYAYIWSCGYEI